MTPLCTVGYEGRVADELIALLIENEIDLVVDVRELPLSRKKGFSKSTLSASLCEAGVGYRHMRALGNPKHLRHALKTGLAFDEFADDFRAILAEQMDAVEELGVVAAEHRVCLLCFEADAERCHRSIVAESVANLVGDSIQVVHLDRAC